MYYSGRSAAGKWRPAVALIAILVTASLWGLGCGAWKGRPAGMPEYCEQAVSYQDLAIRFAPDLYLNSSEPFPLVAVVPVFHPSRPMIAYHMFFRDDAMLAGRGKDLDHEIMWVQYDPVTLKVADVLTLWHRAVLRTDLCAADARLRGQHPRICVQWGQHGMLPFGWESLLTARPRLELLMHYEFARYINRIPKASSEKPPVAFKGSYEAYTTFSKEVHTSAYVETTEVVVALNSDEDLRSLVPASIYLKKQWPDW